MLVLAGDKQGIVSSDILLRAVLRSDLTAIPSTVEVEVRDDPSIRTEWGVGKTITVGRDGDQFRIVKSGSDNTKGVIQGPRKVASIQVTGLLASCAPIATQLQRSVIQEQTSFGAIYRACGAQLRIAGDVPVGRFSCFMGSVPSYGIATALHEQAAAVSYRAGKLSFRRLDDLMTQKPTATLPEAADKGAVSPLTDKHQIPFGFSVGPDGSTIFGRRESGRAAHYWPRSTTAILNNLSKVLVVRRQLDSDFAPDVLAGDVLVVGEKPYVVITAAHIWDSLAFGQAQYSRFWVGEVGK